MVEAEVTSTRTFISYAREDAEPALRLYEDLLGRGFEPWIDVKDLLPGQDFRSAIRQAIRDSSRFIALLSTRSLNKRGFVQAELSEALAILDEIPQGEIFLIPVRLESCEPSDEKLKALHWVDLFEDYERAVQLIEATLRHTSKPAQADEFIGKVNRTIAIVNQLVDQLQRLKGSDDFRPMLYEQAAFSTFGIRPDQKRPAADIESGYAALILMQREKLCELAADSRVTLKLILKPWQDHNRPQRAVRVTYGS